MTDPREPYGRLVRQVWVTWAAQQENPKPSWLLPWMALDDGQREAGMRIGSAVAEVARAEVRGRFGHALREHYLAGITCDRARKEDNPVCGCSRVFLGWHPSVGEAVEAWIVHVMEMAGDEGEPGGH